jgi:hypothetical protein
MLRVSKVPSAKKQAQDAKRLAKLLQRIKRNLKARQSITAALEWGRGRNRGCIAGVRDPDRLHRRHSAVQANAHVRCSINPLPERS